MTQRLSQLSLLVRDYDEAIAYYVGKLGFALIEDTALDASKRWVTVAPKGGETRLLLAKAVGERQLAVVGDQSGGRVFLFLQTDDFAGDYAAYVERGVKVVREPIEEPYGTVAVLEDIYGNQWDLIEPKG